MRVTKSFLSLPPFLSTGWEHVASLRLESEHLTGAPLLVVNLRDGSRVEVPRLNDTVIEAVFAAHEAYLEERRPEVSEAPPLFPLLSDQLITFPLKFGEEGGLAGGMAHAPEQAEMEDLPPELLEKVASVAHALGADELFRKEQPVAGCNCFFCQVSRASGGEPVVEEEEVKDEELAFRSWDIQESGDQLYTVTNPLDATEKYSVYLGTPVGCTCGEKSCEHIRAVLNS